MLFSCHWALGVRSKGPLLASPKVMAWIPPTTRVLGYGPWHAGSEISMGCMMRHVPPHPYIDEFYTEAILLVLFMAGCCFDWKEKGNLYQEVTQPNNQPHLWVGEQHDFLIGSVLKNPTKRCTINNIGYYGSAIYFDCTYDCIIMLLLSMHVDIRQQLFNKGFIYTKTIF